MKTIRKKYWLFIIPAVLFFSSCKTAYYYSTLDSQDTSLSKNEKGNFIFENDTLTVKYSFKGFNLPVSFHIYNKLSTPLLLDWSRSSLIIDRESRSYADTEADTEDILYIPPQSRVNATATTLSNFPFESDPDSLYTKQNMTDINNKEYKVLSQSFDVHSSPLLFQNYLTLYTTLDGKKDKPIVLQHSFYISEVIKTTKIKESKMPLYHEKENIFYLSQHKTSPAVTVFGVIGAVGIVGTAVYFGDGEEE